MKKITTLLIILGFLINCSDDNGEPPTPEIVTAPKISELVIDDITNNGNGSDLEISFDIPSDETLIQEYRIMVVKAINASGFNLATAESLSEGNYTSIAPSGNDIAITLNSTSVDSDSDTLEEGIEYVVYVLSVADGTNATENALSFSSNEISLAQTSIKIVYVGNDGVYISDGSNAVIVDALPGDLDGWSPLATGLQRSIEAGSGDYNNIKAAMITHNHGDHVSFSSVNTFMLRNSEATIIAPPDITSSLNASNQINDLSPAAGESALLELNEISITVLNMSHFDAFGNDFSSVINFSYLIEIGGLKVLHLGDFEYSMGNLESFNLPDESIDIVMIPALSPFLNDASKSVIDNGIGASHVIALHLQSSTSPSQVTAVYPDADVFNKSLQFLRF